VIDPSTFAFNFGKYRGQQYNDVIGIDPFYIQWCSESIEWFTLPPDDQAELDALCDKETRR